MLHNIRFKQGRYKNFEYEVTEMLWIQWEWKQMEYCNINNGKCHVKIQERQLCITTINFLLSLHNVGYEITQQRLSCKQIWHIINMMGFHVDGMQT